MQLVPVSGQLNCTQWRKLNAYDTINGYPSAMIISHDVITTSVIANQASKYQTDLLFVCHPLPGFKLRLPRPQPNLLEKLDRLLSYGTLKLLNNGG